MKYYSKSTNHPLNTKIYEGFTNVSTVASFKSIIDQNWCKNINKKYGISVRILTDIAFIFLCALFNMINKSNINLHQLNQSTLFLNKEKKKNIYNYLNILLKNGVVPVHFEKKNIISINQNYGNTFIHHQEFIAKLFEYLLQKQSQYERQGQLNLSQITKITKRLKPKLTISFHKLLQHKLHVDKVLRQIKSIILKNVKFNQNLLNRPLSFLKIYNSNNAILQPTTLDISGTEYLIDESSGEQLMKSGALSLGSKIMKNLKFSQNEFHRSISFSKIHNRKNTTLLTTTGDLSRTEYLIEESSDIETNKSSALSFSNKLLKAELKDILLQSRLESKQIKYDINQQKQDLIFSTFGINKVELAHTRQPIAVSPPVSIKETSQFSRHEEKEGQSSKTESKNLPEEFGQVLFKSPVINRLADQVSNVLERRLFIERERRGF